MQTASIQKSTKPSAVLNNNLGDRTPLNVTEEDCGEAFSIRKQPAELHAGGNRRRRSKPAVKLRH